MELCRGWRRVERLAGGKEWAYGHERGHQRDTKAAEGLEREERAG